MTRKSRNLSSEMIVQAALKQLNRVGLERLTVRVIAQALDVQAPALYWHFQGKQELLDAMAAAMFAEAVSGLEGSRQSSSWEEWIADCARRLRRTMLRYRDGGRVFGGTFVPSPTLFRTVELSLRTLQDAGFELGDAAQFLPILLNFTVGFVIEEQARDGLAYASANPYDSSGVREIVDEEQFPLTAKAIRWLFDPDTDGAFENGIRIILTGMRHCR